MNTFLASFSEKISRANQEVPELRFLGESILVTPTTFSSFEQALSVCQDLENALLKLRHVMGVGRGLAAPQIGSGERCFVTFVDGEFQHFINPRIESSSGDTNWYRETCLSCGPLTCDVERPVSVVLSFIDKEGNERKEPYEGFWARLVQHETDHLDGTLNVHRAHKEDIEIISTDPLKESLRLKRN